MHLEVSVIGVVELLVVELAVGRIACVELVVVAFDET